jgi:predicted O-methyltransferase YrrM
MSDQTWSPAQLLQLSGGYWQACTLHAGVKLDVFSVLGEGKSTGEAALALGCDQRGLTMLLAALTAMGLLEGSSGQYRNTPAASAFLSRDSPQYLGHIIKHHHHLMESWSHLDQAVKGGHPLQKQSTHSDEEWRESFQLGMFNLAMQTAPSLVKQISLGDRRRLLDLGGGPGTWAIHFCLENPALQATVFDLPTTRPFAEETIARFAMEQRIEFTPGNFLIDDVPGGYDVAWLSHILHGEGPDECRRILAKAVSALEPGGLLIVHEFIMNDDLTGPLFPALFSLNMLGATEKGQSYTEKHLIDMMISAGARDIRRLPLPESVPSGILLGAMP